MFRETVENLLEVALKERTDLFLIEMNISASNTISVIIDGDESISVNDCIEISRAIEHNLDREDIDFSLEVASAGVSSPLTHIRQYKKNIGRDLEVLTTSGNKIKGQLSDVKDDTINLKWKAREPKPVGKGKITVDKALTIAISDIKEAKVKIKF